MKERVMYDIIWNSAPLLLIGPCGTHVSEIWIKWNDVNSKHAFENIVCKMAAILWSDIQALYIYISMTIRYWYMMTSSNGNIFRVTGHLYGEFTGPRWIPRTKASDAELWCFLWSESE